LLPSPTHFISHNIIHTFLVNTQNQLERLSLRQLFEFVLASRTFGEQIDWNDIRNRFDSHGYGKALRQYLALANTVLGFQVPNSINMDGRDRPRIQPYLIHLDLENRGALWIFNLLRQVRSRLRALWRKPRKTFGKLFTLGVYRRFIDSILGADR